MRRALTGLRAALGQLAEASVVEEGADGGFTLLELMVVLLILAVLMAIAVPTFLGVRSGAEDRSAQSDLVNSAIAMKTIYATDGTFYNILSGPSEIQAEEPEIHYTLGPVTASPPHQVEVVVSPIDNNVVLLVDESATGRCWLVEVNEEASASASVPTWWTQTQGISYGGTTTDAGQQSFCWVLPPTLGTSAFSGWLPKFPS